MDVDERRDEESEARVVREAADAPGEEEDGSVQIAAAGDEVFMKNASEPPPRRPIARRYDVIHRYWVRVRGGDPEAQCVKRDVVWLDAVRRCPHRRASVGSVNHSACDSTSAAAGTRLFHDAWRARSTNAVTVTAKVRRQRTEHLRRRPGSPSGMPSERIDSTVEAKSSGAYVAPCVSPWTARNVSTNERT